MLVAFALPMWKIYQPPSYRMACNLGWHWPAACTRDLVHKQMVELRAVVPDGIPAPRTHDEWRASSVRGNHFWCQCYQLPAVTASPRRITDAGAISTLAI